MCHAINSLVNILHSFLIYKSLLQCQSVMMTRRSQMVKAAPPGLSSETTKQESSVLLVCARKVLEMLSSVVKTAGILPSFVSLHHTQQQLLALKNKNLMPYHLAVVLMFTTAT